MKLYSPEDTLIAAKSSIIVFILIVVTALLLSNCSVQFYAANPPRITKVTVFCGKLEKNYSGEKKDLYYTDR